MNKAELVEALAQHYDGSKAEGARALKVVVDTITRSTAAGEKVAITGFGVFERVQRPARTVRNPRTGERKEAPATAVPRFRAGTELKAYVAGLRELPELAVGGPVRAARPARTSTRRPTATTQPAAGQEPLVASAPGPRSSAEPPKAVDKSASKKADARKSAAKKADAKKADAKKADAKKADAKKADAKKSGAKRSGKKSAKK